MFDLDLFFIVFPETAESRLVSVFLILSLFMDCLTFLAADTTSLVFNLFFVLTVSLLSLVSLKSLLGRSLAEASLSLGETTSLTLPYLVSLCTDYSCFSYNSFLLELFDVLFSTSGLS
jgi:hypothetical protein